MYITVDDIKNEISFDDPTDNGNGNKRVGLIRAYFVLSFYNVENDEKIHLNNRILRSHIIPLKDSDTSFLVDINSLSKSL